MITPIGHRTKYAEPLLSLCVRNHKIINKKAILPKPSKPQVSFYSHGNLFSWLIIPTIWAITLCEGGFSDYKSSILFHPLVFKTPLLSQFGHFLAGGYKATSAKDVIHALDNRVVDHFGTMPEASNCNFKYDQPIAPFKYNGLISVGVATNSDFLLVVHKGTEAWNKCIDFPLSYKKRKGFLLSLPLKKLEEVVVHFSIYRPKLKARDLKNVSKRERIRLANIEGERMRERMIKIYNSL